MIEYRLRRFASLLVTSLLLFAIAETPADAGAWDWATGTSSRAAEDGRDWGIEITPYAWIAGVEGDVGLPATGTIPVNATFSDLAGNLDGAFAGFLDARYRRWRILVDGSWVRLRDSVAPPQPVLLQAAVESSVAFGLGGVSYELPVD